MQTISDTQLPTIDAVATGESSAGNVTQAISMIDGTLLSLVKRDLVATTEVVDLLLDVRTLLAETIPSVN
jgi:hypothetical protein